MQRDKDFQLYLEKKLTASQKDYFLLNRSQKYG